MEYCHSQSYGLQYNAITPALASLTEFDPLLWLACVGQATAITVRP